MPHAPFGRQSACRCGCVDSARLRTLGEDSREGCRGGARSGIVELNTSSRRYIRSGQVRLRAASRTLWGGAVVAETLGQSRIATVRGSCGAGPKSWTAPNTSYRSTGVRAGAANTIFARKTLPNARTGALRRNRFERAPLLSCTHGKRRGHRSAKFLSIAQRSQVRILSPANFRCRKTSE